MPRRQAGGPRVVLLTFGGRRDRMSLLKRYVAAAVDRGIIDEWHVWNFARVSHDDAWLRTSFPAVRRTGDDCHYHLVANAHVPVVARHDLRFAVRAGHNAHVALIPRNRRACYELVLGGWGNSAVALRTWPPGTLPDHAAPHRAQPDLVRPAPALLSARAWREVTLSVARQDTALSIVVNVEGREVMSFSADDPAPSAFDVAVMTGYGGEADWRFAADKGEIAGLYHATPERRFHRWNPVYQYYAADAAAYAQTVFVKCDDDIVYVDLDELPRFIAFRRAHPELFLVSANVVNNGVCGHVQQRLGLVPERLMSLEMPAGGFRGSLWESGAKAAALHDWFLDDPAQFCGAAKRLNEPIHRPEARFSINFVAWMGADLRHFETRFQDDEVDLTTTLPRFLGRENAIYLPFVAAHLSFRPQEDGMDVAGLLARYRALADDTFGSAARRTSRHSLVAAAL